MVDSDSVKISYSLRPMT